MKRRDNNRGLFIRNAKRFTVFLVFIIIVLFTAFKGFKIVLTNSSFADKEKLEEEADLEKELEDDSEHNHKLEEKLDMRMEESIEEEAQREESKGNLKEKEVNIQEDEIKTEEDDLKIEEENKEEMDFNQIFSKDIFLGDSRVDSLAFYGIVDEEKVVSELGFTAKKAIKKLDYIESHSPENIYILLGLNDMLNYRESGKFMQDYEKLIDSINERLPETKIYIHSILPVADKVKDKKPFLTNGNIENFNYSLSEFVEKKSLNYMDINYIIQENEDLLEPDGIHLKYDFYNIWLKKLVEERK